MQFELRHLSVSNVEFSTSDVVFNETAPFAKLIDETLILSKSIIERELLNDTRIESIELSIARPGDSCRIVPVKDVIEPRAKLDGECFPGFQGDFFACGSGITYALKGCAVVSTGAIVGFQEGLIDMSGPMTEYCPFSSLINIVMCIEKNKDLNPHEHEALVRETGIKLASIIAKSVVEDSKEELGYELAACPERLCNKAHDSNLPKVVYVYPLMSQGLLHDTYLYGKATRYAIPTIINEAELADGAIVSGNCVSPGSKTTTYHHQNNAAIRALKNKDGSELDFAGIVVNPLMTRLDDKYRHAKMVKEICLKLGARAALISMEGFGNPTTDLMLMCRLLEEVGISTVLISNEDAGVDGFSESLPDGNKYADAMVSTGNSNATIRVPKMDKVLGDLSAIERLTGGSANSIQDDGSIVIEIHAIMGSHNLQGFSKLSCMNV